MFFINKYPLSNWGHPCNYMFIGSNNGEVDIIESNFYPTKPSLADMDKIKSSVVTFDESVFVKPMARLQLFQTKATYDSNKYAVIISGSGNPGNFYSSSSTTASVLANSSSTSPIVITAKADGSTLTQTFRLYLKNTYSIMNDNSSILNINLENQETNNLFLQERDLIHDTSDKKHHSMCSSPEELVARTCPYVNNLPDKIFDLQNI